MQTSNFFIVLFFALTAIFISSCSKSDDITSKVSQVAIIEKDLTYVPELEIQIPEATLGENVKSVRKTFDNPITTNELKPLDYGIWSIEAYLNNKYGSASFKFSEIERAELFYDLSVSTSENLISEEKISKAINDITVFMNQKFDALEVSETNKHIYYIDIKPYQDKKNHIIIKAKIAYGVISENIPSVGELVLRNDCLSTYTSRYAFGSQGVCDGTPSSMVGGTSVSPWDGGQVVEKVVTNKLRLDDSYDCINSSPLPSYPPGYAYYSLKEKLLDYDSHFDYGGDDGFSSSCMVRADYISNSNKATNLVNYVVVTYFPANYHASDLDLRTRALLTEGHTFWHFGSLTTGGLIGSF